MIEVKATSKFKEYGVYPLELDIIPEEGTVFKVTEDRLKALLGDNSYNTNFVEVVEHKIETAVLEEKNNKNVKNKTLQK